MRVPSGSCSFHALPLSKFTSLDEGGPNDTNFCRLWIVVLLYTLEDCGSGMDGPIGGTLKNDSSDHLFSLQGGECHFRSKPEDNY